MDNRETLKAHNIPASDNMFRETKHETIFQDLQRLLTLSESNKKASQVMSKKDGSPLQEHESCVSRDVANIKSIRQCGRDAWAADVRVLLIYYVKGYARRERS